MKFNKKIFLILSVLVLFLSFVISIPFGVDKFTTGELLIKTILFIFGLVTVCVLKFVYYRRQKPEQVFFNASSSLPLFELVLGLLVNDFALLLRGTNLYSDYARLGLIILVLFGLGLTFVIALRSTKFNIKASKKKAIIFDVLFSIVSIVLLIDLRANVLDHQVTFANSLVLYNLIIVVLSFGVSTLTLFYQYKLFVNGNTFVPYKNQQSADTWVEFLNAKSDKKALALVEKVNEYLESSKDLEPVEASKLMKKMGLNPRLVSKAVKFYGLKVKETYNGRPVEEGYENDTYMNFFAVLLISTVFFAMIYIATYLCLQAVAPAFRVIGMLLPIIIYILFLFIYIKETLAAARANQKTDVQEIVVPEEPVEEVPVEEVKEEPAPVVVEPVVEVEPVVVEEPTGPKYKYSFMSRLVMAQDPIQNYYTEIKNMFLSYNKVKTKVTWGKEIVSYGTHRIALINTRGKNLLLYLELNPADYAETKIRYKDLSEKKAFAKTPLLIKVRSDRSLKQAKQLITDLMAKQEAVLNEAYEAADFHTEAYTVEQMLYMEPQLVKLSKGEMPPRPSVMPIKREEKKIEKKIEKKVEAPKVEVAPVVVEEPKPKKKDKKPVKKVNIKPSYEQYVNSVSGIEGITCVQVNENMHKFYLGKKQFLATKKSTKDYKIIFYSDPEKGKEMMKTNPKEYSVSTSPKGDNWFKFVFIGDFPKPYIMKIAHDALDNLKADIQAEIDRKNAEREARKAAKKAERQRLKELAKAEAEAQNK